MKFPNIVWSKPTKFNFKQHYTIYFLNQYNMTRNRFKLFRQLVLRSFWLKKNSALLFGIFY